METIGQFETPTSGVPRTIIEEITIGNRDLTAEQARHMIQLALGVRYEQVDSENIGVELAEVEKPFNRDIIARGAATIDMTDTCVSTVGSEAVEFEVQLLPDKVYDEPIKVRVESAA